VSRLAQRLREDFVQASAPARFIHLSRWVPDIEHFPFATWQRLLQRHLRRRDAELFDYARSPQGYEPLRRELAAYLGRSRAVHCTADDVVIVNGSQQALEFCARLLLEQGDAVAFENPGYLGTRRIFLANGARLSPVRVDTEGMVVGEIPPDARAVYATPSHQFPTGASLSLKRRLELIDWARQQHAAIIEDDYDSEYRYSGVPLPALQGLAPHCVVYCGTFSKVMFPGLRVGYIVPPPSMRPIFTRLKWLSDRHTPILEQAALADFLHEGHLDRHIRRMRRLYGQRREVLLDSLQQHFGSRVTIYGDEAGMHVMAQFDDPTIYERALRNRVQVVNASAYYLTKPPRGEVILGFSCFSERAIKEAVRRLSVS
jgi:GntR family transcriptional regulator/MocR family aminotransferase